MLESHDARRRFNRTFEFGSPVVDGPWDFGLNDDQDNGLMPHETRPAPGGADAEKASELAAIPGIVSDEPESSRTSIAASTFRGHDDANRRGVAASKERSH
jgi:hypothetical protein